MQLMDLSERTKIKQEIVKETGYKTAINEQTLCEDKYAKCYMINNSLMFETKILGDVSVYKLSGHPYDPIVFLDCTTDSDKSFQIQGEGYFPNMKDDIAEWLSFSKYINSRIILNKYAISYNEYIPKPNQKVAIRMGYNDWYLCVSDERNVLDICGSFSNNTMAYILADKEQRLYFEEYKYNDSEKEKYMYDHYRNLDDIK